MEQNYPRFSCLVTSSQNPCTGAAVANSSRPQPKTFKNLRIALLALVFTLLAPFVANATHIVGGVLTYEYLGGSSYRITYKFYRDCAGVNMPNSVTVNVRKPDGGQFNPNKDFVINGFTSQIVPSFIDTCASGNLSACVEERVFTTVRNDLPPGMAYHLYVQDGNRNATILNISNPSTYGATYYARIPGAIWYEDFTLANNTTVDNGTTAWSRTVQTTNYASVQNNLFEVSNAGAEVVWTSQAINIAAYTTGVNLSVGCSQSGNNMENTDSLCTSYSLNGGPFIPFTTNGALSGNFGAVAATATGLISPSIRIRVRMKSNANNELHRIDDVVVSYTVPNSSPVFTNFPPVFVCVNKPVTFNHVATDIDGDSLVYSLYQPYTNAAPTFPGNGAISFTGVPYIGTFNANSPLQQSGSATMFISQAGVLTCTPPNLGQYVVGVKVREYRNQKLLGEVTRDFQFNVLNCPPPAQALIVSSGVINACGGLAVTFPNNSSSSATNFAWDFGVLTSTTDTSSAKFPTYTYGSVGTYNVRLIINAGTSCADTAFASCIVGFANASFTHNAPQCAGVPIVFTNTSTKSTNATITGYSWFFGDGGTSTLTNPTHSYTTGGTYSVKLKVFTNIGCIDSITTNITINPIPNPSIAGTTTICAGSSTTLTASGGTTYSWNTGQTTAAITVSPSTATTYTVTATAGGCSNSATVQVTVNPNPVPTITGTSTICNGQSTTLTASGATTYSWNTGATTAAITVSPTTTTTYTVTGTTGGCSRSTTIAVTVNPIPNPTISGTSAICAGGSTTLTAAGGTTYSWNTGQTTAAINVSPTVTTTYTVTATTGGCSNTATQQVTVTPLPTPSISGTSTICNGQSTTLTASGGTTYSWNTGASTAAITVSPSTNTTYTVTATTSGCSNSTTIAVTVNPKPTVTITGTATICAGNSTTLTGNGGSTYSWNTGATTAAITVSPTTNTTYTVTATDVNGCTNSATRAVTVNPLPTPTITGTTGICSGNSTTITATGGNTYSWNTGQTTAAITVSPTTNTTYTVTATALNGCTNTATVLVTVSPKPTPTVSGNTTICNGTSTTLTASGGTTYSWNTGASTAAITVSPSTNTTYTVTANTNGCTNSTTVSVTVNPKPTVTVTGTSTICAGASTTLTGNGGISYSWNTGATTTSITVSPTSTTIYTVTATDNNGCTNSASRQVTVTPLPNANITGNSGICSGNSTTLTATGGGTYSWNTGQTTAAITVSPTTNTTYTVTVTTSGCTNTATVQVTVSPKPTPTITGTTTICSGQSTTLTANGGNTYSWNTGASTAAITVSPSTSTTYTVTADVNGCTNSTTILVTVNPTPAAPTLNSNSPVCQGNTLNLTSNFTSGATYTWIGPNSFSSSLQNPSITGVTTAAAGVYTVTITVNGCTSPVATVNVQIGTPPTASAGTNQTVCANNPNVVLSGTSTTGSGVWSTSGSGTWSPNNISLNTTYIPSNADTAAGTVTLTLTTTNNLGCTPATSQIVITITNAPRVDAGIDRSVCSNNANVILAGVVSGGSSTGSWSTSGSGSWSPNNVTLNATYMPSSADTLAGSVTLYLTSTNNGNCLPVIDSMKITYTNAPSVNAGKDTTICLSNPNYQLAGSSSTGSGTWSTLGSGSWSPNNNTLNATYIPSSADTSAGQVILILTSTNNGGCNPVKDTMVIKYRRTPTVNAGGNQTLCANNATVNLNGATSTGTGIWSTSGSGTFSPNNVTLNAQYIPSAADTAAGSVTLTLTATGGCALTSQTITITFTNAPIVTAGANMSACKTNPNVTLNGSLGGSATSGQWSSSGSGSWSPNNTSMTTTYIPSSADTAAGSVTIILTSTNNGNCLPATDTLVITYTNPPVAKAGADITICTNGVANLNGQVIGGGGTGIWSTTNGTGTFIPNNTTLNGQYKPSNQDTVTKKIILVLTSTNNGGCLAARDTVVITVIPGPIVNAGPDQSICSNNPNVTLAGAVSIATGAKWSTLGSGTFSPNDSTLNGMYIPSAADTSAGSVTMVLTSTGNGQCAASTDTMVITFTPRPIVNAGADIYICKGVLVAGLNGSVSGGSSTGQWSTLGSGSFSPNNTTLNANYLLSNADTAAGKVTLILTSTNNGSCVPVSDTVVIRITSIPTTLAGADTTLCGNNATFQLNGQVIGGSGTGKWTSSGTGTFTPNDSTLNATYVPSAADITSGSVTLVLTATKACQLVSDTITITFTPAPTASAGADVVICAGSNVNLNGVFTIAGGAKWSTSGSGTFTPNDSSATATYIPSAADITAGQVTIVYSTTGNGNCLAAKDSLVITIESKPVADFVHSPACLNAVINFTDTSTVQNGTITTWAWSFGATTKSASTTFSSTGSQTITLIVATGGGCSDTVTKSIYVNPLPTALFTWSAYCPDSAMFVDGSSVSGGTIGGWNWNFGDSTNSNLQNPNHTYLTAGTYLVTLTAISDSGCVSILTDSVTVDDCDQPKVGKPAVPSAFTPNGDNHNDVLFVKGGPFKELDFRVFNEWGIEIFRSYDQARGWDGSFHNKMQPGGVYVWVLNGVTIDDVSVKMVGDVTMIK